MMPLYAVKRIALSRAALTARRPGALSHFTVEDRGFKSPCWLHAGALKAKGYGHAALNGRNGMAHRIAYERLIGPIPAGLQLDHLCRVKHCINPQHLEPVTNQENMIRAKAHITHCPSGHEYDAANTIHSGRGRDCRQCRRDRRRRKAIAVAVNFLTGRDA